MLISGIICEYNPIHFGHIRHISETKRALGEDCGIVCVMSGNFVQRGDIAIFEKYARAAAAVLSGADLVLELPSIYALSSAERFAMGGVGLLESAGVVDYISFGSESGDIGALSAAADTVSSEAVSAAIGEELKKGLSYAEARQNAAFKAMGGAALILGEPNNILAVEYLKALKALNSDIKPITVKRLGAGHDSEEGASAAAVRRTFKSGGEPWEHIPDKAALVFKREMTLGRGPVFLEELETAVLSRLRMLPEAAFKNIPDSAEGLENRLARYSHSEPGIAEILEKTKTKRYAMSRIRRMLLCAALGISSADTQLPPQYIKVLAMNGRGREIMRLISKQTELPCISKPAAAKKLEGKAGECFFNEAAHTDLYTLAFKSAESRRGGAEWKSSPTLI